MLAALGENPLDQDDELIEILVRLGREPDHRVDLDEVPPPPEGDVRCLDHVRVGEGLVDDTAQPVRAGLGREGEAGLPDFGDRVRQPDREGLARNEAGDRNAPVGELRSQHFTSGSIWE